MSTIVEKVLKKTGLKSLNDLTFEERETLLNDWLPTLNPKDINSGDIKDHIQRMKEGVEKELSEINSLKSRSVIMYLITGRDRDLMLKARLKNYLLLEAFLTAPEKAKEALEDYIDGLATKIKK